MIKPEDFEPKEVPIFEYMVGGPPVKESDLIEAHRPLDPESLYTMMIALKRGAMRRQKAAVRLAQATTVEPLNDGFYAVKFTVFGADQHPELEADTIFQHGMLYRPMNVTETLRLGGQAITGAYFQEQIAADGERVEDGPFEHTAVDMGQPVPVPALG